MKRSIVYVDGYNWYHGIFKHRPEWKWLNVHKFFQTLRPRETIVCAKIFSAMIEERDARDRQERYFSALRATPCTEVILGKFQQRNVTCGGDCLKPYVVYEEKKTDVNMAVHMMSDAVDAKCDHMCIVTADSDIQPAVEWIAKRYPGIALLVYVPVLPCEQRTRRTDYYQTKNLNVQCQFMPLNGLEQSQFQNCVTVGQGRLAVRPHSWKSSLTPN